MIAEALAGSTETETASGGCGGGGLLPGMGCASTSAAQLKKTIEKIIREVRTTPGQIPIPHISTLHRRRRVKDVTGD